MALDENSLLVLCSYACAAFLIAVLCALKLHVPVHVCTHHTFLHCRVLPSWPLLTIAYLTLLLP